MNKVGTIEIVVVDMVDLAPLIIAVEEEVQVVLLQWIMVGEVVIEHLTEVMVEGEAIPVHEAGVEDGITTLDPDRAPDPAVDIIDGGIIREVDRDHDPVTRIRTRNGMIRIAGDLFLALDQGHRLMTVMKRK